MKRLIVAVCAAVAVLGCARVRVEGPKEPIKVDVSMRLDIYQHVAKDINDIENMVSGPAQPLKPSSFLRGFVTEAYAQEGFGADVENAAQRRKERKPSLAALLQKGALGENNLGLVDVRKDDPAARALAEAENADRMVIYHAIAGKNGTSLDEVQKPYAKRLQQDAPSGSPVQDASGTWSVKP